MSELTVRRRILGIDYGRARIGIAVSDELGLLAHPVETIRVADGSALQRIAEIIGEKDIERVIIGVPRHMNGSLGESAAEATAFADKLRKLVSCDVLPWDERLSTVAANRMLQERGQKTRDSRAFVDQVAAQIILQGYLDRLQNARERQTQRETA